MFRSKKYYIKEEKGFALVAALLACLILMALGTLVITLSTGDIGTSSRLVGEKRAVTAAEKGITSLAQNFDPQNLAASAGNTTVTDLAADPKSQYTIGTPIPATTGPDFIRLPGYGNMYGLSRFNADVTGQNTQYNTRITIRAGVGYGPVPMY